MADQQASSRDIPGRQREYETTYILRPETPETGISEVNSRVRGIIEDKGGILLKVENWGRRRLAYEVKKNVRGTYLHFNYLGQSGTVEEIERNLRLLDAVIRYYTVKVAENVDPKSRTSSVTDESFAEAATPGPDQPEESEESGGYDRRFSSDDDDDDDDRTESRRGSGKPAAKDEAEAKADGDEKDQTKAKAQAGNDGNDEAESASQPATSQDEEENKQ